MVDESMTLDPPGSIAVIGAGPLGVEAALYGRFLGYDVTIVEAVAVGASMRAQTPEPLPMLPDRCLSPLAMSALDAQSQQTSRVLPMTVGQWIDEALVPLTETDLLRGRLRMPARVTKITMVAVERDDSEEDEGEIPADFRLTWIDSHGDAESLDAESVLLATGMDCDIEFDFQAPLPYLFQVTANGHARPEESLATGLHQIVAIYAQLAGRADLDLYRPRRG